MRKIYQINDLTTGLSSKASIEKSLKKIHPVVLSELIKSTFQLDQNNYCDGNCVEMALALNSLLPNSRLLVGSRTWTYEGEEYENILSHVVVQWQGEEFDYGGINAIERWEERYKNPYDCGGEEEIAFDWKDVSKGGLENLTSMVRDQARKVDKKLVLEIYSRMQIKILNPNSKVSKRSKQEIKKVLNKGNFTKDELKSMETEL
jgi:hypothetical protein